MFNLEVYYDTDFGGMLILEILATLVFAKIDQACKIIDTIAIVGQISIVK